MTEKTQIQIINEEVNRELADPKTGAALLATTFKGLDATLMKQAIMEGMIRGFTFKNFLQKDIYALPFKQKVGNTNTWSTTYSLITSIDYARKIAQKAGQCGKKKPVFAYKDDGKNIDTCEVTVQKLIGSYVGDYTAEVSFDEYNKKKNLWLDKPKTMIAKVAEMHALRSAFPEEFSQLYIEEEIGKETRANEVKTVDKSGLTMKNITKPNDQESKESEDTDKKVPSSDSNTDDEDKGN
jgi:phage recombination protein Bet